MMILSFRLAHVDPKIEKGPMGLAKQQVAWYRLIFGVELKRAVRVLLSRA